MRKRPAAPSEADTALFREAVGPVRELSTPPQPPRAPPPAPRPRQFERDEAEALAISRRDPFVAAEAAQDAARLHAQAHVGEKVLRRLRRGQFAVQDEIDLHRLSAAEADTVLRAFLADCRRHDRRCVRIVHGKGLHSGSAGPVLKGLIETRLRQRADVLAYAQAPPAQGGAGALLVLLARRREGEAAGAPITPARP